MTSVVHFVLPNFLLLFCLIDLRSVPTKARLKTKLKDLKICTEKSVTNDFKVLAASKLTAVSDSVFYNDITKAYGIFRKFKKYIPKPNPGMMDDIGNIVFSLRDIAICLSKHFCQLLSGQRVTCAGLLSSRAELLGGYFKNTTTNNRKHLRW